MHLSDGKTGGIPLKSYLQYIGISIGLGFILIGAAFWTKTTRPGQLKAQLFHQTVLPDQGKGVPDSGWQSFNGLFQSSYTTNNIWIKIRLTNEESHPVTQVVEFYNGHINQADWFTEDGSIIARQGINVVYGNTGGIKHFRPAINVAIEPNSRKTVYLRLNSYSLIYGQVQVFTPYEFNEYQTDLTLAFGLFLGSLAFLVAYQLFLAISLKDKAYLLYALMVTITDALLLLPLTGFSSILFSDLSLWFSSRAGVIGHGAITLVLPFFCLAFFERQHTGKIEAIIKRVALAIAAPAITVSLLPMSIWTYPILGVFLWSSICVALYVTVRNVRSLDRNALLFVAGWSPLVLGGLIQFLSTLGLLPLEWHSETTLLLAAGLESLILAMALGDRYRKILDDHARAEQQKQEQMAREQQASLMQEALLIENKTPQMLASTYYRSADEIGGDWYGYFFDELHDRVFILVGDVSGHGMASALLSATIAGAARTAVGNLSETQDICLDESLRAIAKAVNRVVLDTRERQDFLMSMVIIGVELESLKGSVINAGHPMVYHISDKRCRAILANGPLLGLSLESKFRPVDFSLSPGDILFAYTDGLLESNQTRNPIKPRELKNMLSRHSNSQEIVDEVVQRFYHANSHEHLKDDVSVVAAKFMAVP